MTWIGLSWGTAAAAVALWPQRAFAADSGRISGVVRDAETGDAVAKAYVIVECSCLRSERSTYTNAQGLYAFKDLPAGVYSVRFYFGEGSATRTVKLAPGQRQPVNVTLEVGHKIVDVFVKSPIEPSRSDVGITLRGEDLKRMPLNPAGDAVSGTIDIDPLGSKDAGGATIGGSSSAEINYTVDGGTAGNPITGSPVLPLPPEFVDTVSVQAGGYEAEFGGASGAQVQARRLSGGNRFRGTARFVFTPRLAEPRAIVQTDNAVRALEVPDYGMQGVASVSGPLIEDRLWISGGVFVVGQRSTLTQSFHSRIDRDDSGGYEECPEENGAFDCVEGGNYIATRKFAEQDFATGGVSAQGFVGLDWAINPRHRVAVTLRGAPGFIRRSYRRPLSSIDPDALGPDPNADPVSGASTVANGIVNDHFGWDRSTTFSTLLTYQGRVAHDKLEIDAGLGYFQSAFDEAWRVDDPELRSLPATQTFSTRGIDLFQTLERENGLELAPGASNACNDSDLPGQTCPVRSWMSGGLGRTSLDRARRAEGWLSFTHFFEGAGSHQLKYGTRIEHVERGRTLRYSGSNESDFYDRCEADGLVGGGEWCYDPELDRYGIDTSRRVDNHRMILVNGSDPNTRTALGFGRVRRETGELRAIATPLGAGARVPKYQETVSSQNYAVFLQDKWAIRSNLFAHAGVRWDMQDMRDVFGERALFIWDNIAPRMGLSYDWTEEGRSRLYASYGWFYQTLPLTLTSRVYGGLINVTRSYQDDRCRRSPDVVGPDGQPRAVFENGQPTEWCVDSNASTTGLTEGATVPGLKGQYDQQFTAGYEHEILEDLIVGVSWFHRDLGRAVEDVSPDGGNNFIIANPGVGVSNSDLSAQRERCQQLANDLDAAEMAGSEEVGQLARESNRCEFLLDAYQKVGSEFTRPTRNYDAFTFQVRKRVAKNWFLVASYTYSRSRGNYDGFVDPITGAINLGASRQYDTPELVRNSYGPLSFDTPHRVKVDGFYRFDFKEVGALVVGSSFRFASGFPISMRVGNGRNQGEFPVYLLPRGTAGRLPPSYQLNLSLQYAYPLRDDMALGVGARLFNVTNARSVLRVDEVYSLDDARPIAGGDLQDLKHAKIRNRSNPVEFFDRQIVGKQGNYLVEAAFQNPLAAQFEVMLTF